MGDIERHLREAGNPRSLDEMSEVIRQSVLTRLQESKDVFVEAAGRWSLKDTNRSDDPSTEKIDDTVNRRPSVSIAAQIKEMDELRCQGIVTDAEFANYKKRKLEE